MIRHLLHLTKAVWLLQAGLLPVFGQESAPAVSDPVPASPPTVFDLPKKLGDYQQLNQSLAVDLNQKKWPDAEAKLTALLKLSPTDPLLHFQLARVEALTEKTEIAFDHLTQAVELGFHSPKVLQSDGLIAVLRLNPKFPKLLARAESLAKNGLSPPASTVARGKVANGIATVEDSNTLFDFRRGIFQSFFSDPEISDFNTASADSSTGGPVGDPADVAHQWLQEQIDQGTAAGHLGDFYDNRDRGHSPFPVSRYPHLARITYGEDATSHRLNQGPQFQLLFNQITFGNSSTAVTESTYWRSHPRHAYTSKNLTGFLAAQYTSNQLYVYPEHRDHDPELGDVFPANTPYLIISQGSSGSDQPFLDSIARCLAALKPEVKARLKQSGATMPTLQMLFRYSNKGIQNDDAYLSGPAHPTVFDAAQLDPLFLVKMANQVTLADLPPVVRLNAIEEQATLSGLDYFGPTGERLFDTPQAIARVFRGMANTRRIVVSAENSVDLNGAPLTYHWKILRGDTERIKIVPLNDNGSVAEIVISHHERRPIASPGSIESNRVDIGVFVNNGTYFSAPGFITYFFLDHEKRLYDEQARILSVDYLDPATKDRYVDPVIDAKRNWRDEFHYDSDAPSTITGWTRTWEGGETQDFTPEGVLVTSRSKDGKPDQVKGVRYLIRQPEGTGTDVTAGGPTVIMEATDNVISYEEYLSRLKKVTGGR